MTSYPSHEYIGLKPHEAEVLPDVLELLKRALRAETDEPIVRIDMWRRMMEEDDVLFVRVAGDRRFFECPIWPETEVDASLLEMDDDAEEE